MDADRKNKLKRRMLRLTLVALILAVTALALAWTTHKAWAAGMLVLTPSPNGATLERPLDAREGIQITRNGAHVRAWVFDPKATPRGTVLLLHGIRDNKLSLVQRARGHASTGLRAVAVDSRGHGESSGRYLTYGVEEALDLIAIVDELERRALLVQPLAVVGTSYGAATALQHAALDPRVERVVAVAPFASLRRVVFAYIQWILGPAALLIPTAVVDDLVNGAATQAGFDADRACPQCVAPRIRASVLLIHSRDDERIPWQHSEQIRDALRSPTTLLLIDGARHVRTGSARGVPEAIARFLARAEN